MLNPSWRKKKKANRSHRLARLRAARRQLRELSDFGHLVVLKAGVEVDERVKPQVASGLREVSRQANISPRSGALLIDMESPGDASITPFSSRAAAIESLSLACQKPVKAADKPEIGSSPELSDRSGASASCRQGPRFHVQPNVRGLDSDLQSSHRTQVLQV